LIKSVLNELHKKYLSNDEGQLASYIPDLTKANPRHFAIAVATTDGQIFTAGDVDVQFTMQSTSKPFAYGKILEDYGREFVLSKIGVEPTGEAFNSIVELEKRTNRPYNPMINSGAIAVSSFVKAKDGVDPCTRLVRMFEDYVGHEVKIDESVFESEKKSAHRNRSIAHLLRHFNVIGDDIDFALDLYFKQCSVLVNTVDLALIAATLANKGVQPLTKHRAIKAEYVSDLLSLMFTCGMYDSSGEWAHSVGIPAKSGVSGGIFGVIPGKLGIAVYSPLIDDKGHSIRGKRVFEEMSHKLGLSIFN
jgi:glutaminase